MWSQTVASKEEPVADNAHPLLLNVRKVHGDSHEENASTKGVLNARFISPSILVTAQNVFSYPVPPVGEKDFGAMAGGGG